MLGKVLEAIVNNAGIPLCAINQVLNACGETHHCNDYKRCSECKEASYETLKKLKEEAENESNWIPVEQRLPEHLVPVLTCDAYGNMHIMSHYEGFEPPFGIGSDHHRFYEVVAWMPLPQPYAKEE